MLYLFAALIATLGVLAFELHLHFKEKRQILDRFMSGDYTLYRAHEDKFKMIDEAKKAEEEKARAVARLTPKQAAAITEARIKSGRF